MQLNHQPRSFLLLILALLSPTTLAALDPARGQEVVDQWRYVLRRPSANWRQPDFDDADWTSGSGGFGMYDTPGARIGTVWSTRDIWLRKTFRLEKIPAKAALLIHHDEDAEVFLNGRPAGKFTGFTVEYQVAPLSKEAAAALREGENLLAVHCRQTGGGQFIDVHLVDAERPPTLPRPQRSTRPFLSDLITTWGEQVSPANAWTEYPRPQLQRDAWLNLNGTWEAAVAPREQTSPPSEWPEKILVPFCLEAKLGGVQRLLDSTESLWYRRAFTLQPTPGRRALLHFEAVDYRCQAWLNGREIGSHQGGNTPFTFDVTDAVQPGENVLVLRVEDDTEAWQLRGKQVLNARGIWYTQVSGIWQTVWLEEVAPTYLADLKMSADPATGELTIRPRLAGNAVAGRLEVRVKDGERVVAEYAGAADSARLRVPQVQPWSPDHPKLYDLEVTWSDAAGNAVDRVASYVGFRTVGKHRDPDGHWRFTLNGEEIFHWGPLDQGWWPDGLLTPPSDEAMRFDIEWLKEAGFNMIRKHIKVEPRRYYYHCDRLGMMVWQDQVSGGRQPPWTRLQPNPEDAEWPEEHHQQFLREFEWMIDSLENHPSIVCWTPFNEAWGQHRTVEVGQWVARRDPTRLVNIASGGNFWPVGDIVDEHRYPHPGFPFELGENGRFAEFVKVVGEFGGHGLPTPGHLWDANRRNWGYGGLPKDAAEYRERYETSLKMLMELKAQGVAGGVYTQTTDVEGEINGLMTYDRKVVKIPAAALRALHAPLTAK